MGGIAGVLGGAANPLAQYGQQVRGLLEQRRGSFASALLQEAQQESDPTHRAALLKGAADLYGGKNIHDVGTTLIPAIQKHQESNAALGMALGGDQKQPPNTPGPAAPGQVSGTVGGSAAQPATSPVSPQAQGPQAVSQPQTIGQGGVIPPIEAKSQQPQPTPTLPAPQPTAGATSPFDARAMRQQIIEKYRNLIMQATPAMRPQIQAEMTAELAHLEPFEQIQQRREQYQMLQSDPSFQALPAWIKAAYAAQAGGFQPVNAPGMTMMPRMISTGTMGSQAPQGTMEYGTNKPLDPNSRYRVMTIPMTGETIWQPEEAQVGTAQTPGGVEQFNRQTGKAIGPVQGAIPPAQNTPFRQPTAGGGVEQTTPANVIGGVAPVPIAGAITPSMMTHTSVSQTPGQPPTTTRRTVGGPSSSGGSTRAGAVPSINTPDPITVEKYREWVNGGPAPTGKELDAVQGYAASNNLPTPTPMSAQGQKDLAQIDDVLTQVHNLKQMMKDRGMDKDDSSNYYKDYFQYMHLGKATPNQDLWTGLSFEGLRSAAAALRGSNARSYPIFSRALEHVPNPTASMTHLPDSPKNMYGKLDMMEKVLTQGRTQIMSDEKKSGVTGSPAGVNPVGVPGVGDTFGGGKVISVKRIQ